MNRFIQRIMAIALAFGMLLAPGVPRAQYPERPVKLVVGFPAGGAADIVARIVANDLSKTLGQQVVVENITGAGATLAARAVASAAPDGYTLLLATMGNAVNPTLMQVTTYDAKRDFKPVSQLVRLPTLMMSHPGAPFGTVLELIGYAKANPGKVNLAMGPIGTSSSLAAEIFALQVGIRWVQVPYRGGAPAMQALLGGQADVFFDAPNPAIGPNAAQGKVRLLAVMQRDRLKRFPDVPSIMELVGPDPALEVVAWNGVLAPAKVADAVVARLHGAITSALNDAEVRQRLEGLGMEIAPSSPSEFGSFYLAEIDRWARVIKEANIKPQ